MLEQIKKEAENATRQLLLAAGLHVGDLVVVGCSTSEIGAHKIGTFSSEETGKAVFEGIYRVLRENHIYLAAHCC